MKKLLLTLSFAVLFTAISIASHIVGGFISYEHLGNNDYKITMKLYRDCYGISAPIDPQLCVRSTTMAYDTLLVLPMDTFIVLTSNTCVPQGLTTCQGGTAFGVEEYTYSSYFHFDPAPDWVMSYTDCCRNGAITTIQADGYFIYTNFDNSTGPNNSPSFINPIFNEYCAGNFTLLDYSCLDIDGDSLVYRLDSCLNYVAAPCMDTTYFSVSYFPGFDYQNFLTSYIPITMNTSSGIISCLPAQLEIAVLSVVVDEYRNGVKIGSMKRDDEVVVSGGIQNPDVITGKVYFDFNNNQVMDSNDVGITGCVIQVQSPNVFATTDQSGNYSIDVLPGSYVINLQYPPPYTSMTPSSHTASFTVLGQLDSLNDFALAPLPGVVDLRVTLTGPWVFVNSQTSHWITVKNVGTTLMGGTLDLAFDSRLSYLTSNPTITSQAGQTLTWNVAPLWPNASKLFYATFWADTTMVTVGDTLHSFAAVYATSPDTNLIDNVDFLEQPVIARLVSYDPNYKEVDPAGNISPQFVQNGDWLEYTIHFQNTGTGPASHVKLMDGLDANLDITSFDKLASSHNCNYAISGPGLLKVNYWNMNLPPQSLDEPGSHGFFKYRIRPKTTLQVGDQINNTANIYFDLNDPIATNTTITTVVNFTTFVEELSSETIKAVFYPNPSTGLINIRTDNKDLTLTIADISGRLLYTKKIYGNETIDITHLSKGMYIYRLESNNRDFAAGKIIKQ